MAGTTILRDLYYHAFTWIEDPVFSSVQVIVYECDENNIFCEAIHRDTAGWYDFQSSHPEVSIITEGNEVQLLIDDNLTYTFIPDGIIPTQK